MFNARFFAPRYFAPRYFPKVGGVAIAFDPGLASLVVGKTPKLETGHRMLLVTGHTMKVIAQ